MRCCTSADNNSFLILYSVNIVHKQVDPPISIEMQRNFFSPNLFGPIIQNKQATVSTVLDTAKLTKMIGGSTCLCTIFTTLFSDECKYDTSWFNDSMLVLCHFQPSNSRVMSIIFTKLKEQTMIWETLHRKLKFEKPKSHFKQ
jgi:hypothetical protein